MKVVILGIESKDTFWRIFIYFHIYIYIKTSPKHIKTYIIRKEDNRAVPLQKETSEKVKI